MLVLTRKKNESISIGDDVAVMVMDIRGDKVRLGISAPQSMAVHRKEIYEAIKRDGGDLLTIVQKRKEKRNGETIRETNRR